MIYPPRKKGGFGALWPFGKCRAGAVRAIWVFGLCLSLAACGSLNGMLGRGGPGAPTPQAQTVPPPYQSEQIGSGPARVALILPMTQPSGPSVVGTSLRNAAELAWAEAGNNDVTLLVKDDRSTPEGARAAAQ